MFVGYLQSCSSKAREKLIQTDVKNEIDKLLTWHQARLKPAQLRLTQAISKFKTSQNAASIKPQQSAIVQHNEISKDLGDVLDFYLPTLESHLSKGKQPFFCGDKLTVIDIIFFMDISQILVLTEKT